MDWQAITHVNLWLEFKCKSLTYTLLKRFHSLVKNLELHAKRKKSVRCYLTDVQGSQMGKWRHSGLHSIDDSQGDGK